MASLGFHKEIVVTKDLCYICGQLRYPTIECPIAIGFMIKSIKLDKGNCPKFIKRNRSTNWLPRWTKGV